LEKETSGQSVVGTFCEVVHEKNDSAYGKIFCLADTCILYDAEFQKEVSADTQPIAGLVEGSEVLVAIPRYCFNSLLVLQGSETKTVSKTIRKLWYTNFFLYIGSFTDLKENTFLLKKHLSKNRLESIHF
jgi:hypothetical protein